MDMGVLAAAVVSQFFLCQKGEHPVRKLCLRCGFYHADGLLMKLGNLFSAMGAKIGTAQQFIHTVTHMGKTQIGNGIHLCLGHIHFEIVFHRSFPRSNRNWAQKPVNRPVMMLHTIITGR